MYTGQEEVPLLTDDDDPCPGADFYGSSAWGRGVIDNTPASNAECDSRWRVFQAQLNERLNAGLMVADVGLCLMSLLDQLETPVGRFAQQLENQPPPCPSDAEPYSADLLPIRIKAIDRRSFSVTPAELGWAQYICTSLNFSWCTAWSAPFFHKHPKNLSPAQSLMVERLLQSVRAMLTEEF